MSPEDSCLPPSSPASDVQITKQPFSLYLFYDHSYNPRSVWCYALYKFVVNLNAPTHYYEQDYGSPTLMEFPDRDYPPSDYPYVNPSPKMIIPTRNYMLKQGMRWGPSPILVFPRRGLWAPKGMRCARLGSKLYFLGGTVEEYYDDIDYPRDVFVFDIAKEEIKLMDARLHAGKPNQCAVFAANGKLYALGRIPHFPDKSLSQVSDYLSEMKLFECYDPSTNKWQVLDDLPPVDIGDYVDSYKLCGIHWQGCNVLEKRQQVVLIGRLFPAPYPRLSQVKLVYHIQEHKWTCHRLPMGWRDAFAALSFQEAEYDNDYLYSLPRQVGQPLKSTSDHVSIKDEKALVFPPCAMDEQDEQQHVDGVVDMSFPNMYPDKSKRELYTWFGIRLRLPYPFTPLVRLLRYAGHGYFCYLSSGSLPNNIYRSERDQYTQGVTITLLKEEIKQEKQHCFVARILHYRLYVIETPFIFTGDLTGCFVVTPEQLQRRLNRKEKNKKKKQNVR